jgi:hypothetical protein
MLACFLALVGFLGTIVLAIVVTSELLPYSVVERHRGSDRPAPIGWIMFVVSLIGAYIGYRLGS